MVVVGSLVGGVVGLVVVLEEPTGGGVVAPVPEEVPVPQVELLPLVVPAGLGDEVPVLMVEVLLVPLVLPMSSPVDLHAARARDISPPISRA